MDSSVSTKDEILFLRLYCTITFQKQSTDCNSKRFKRISHQLLFALFVTLYLSIKIGTSLTFAGGAGWWWIWDGVVSTTTTLRDGGSWVRILTAERLFIFPETSRPPLGPLCWLPELFLEGRVKQPGREAEHSLPSSSEVKNGRSHISTPPICLHRVDRGNFKFLP